MTNTQFSKTFQDYIHFGNEFASNQVFMEALYVEKKHASKFDCQ